MNERSESTQRTTETRAPDLVRIENVRHEMDEEHEGDIGLLVDTDIDNNGHGVYTVHIPALNKDVQARKITTLSKAQLVGG